MVNHLLKNIEKFVKKKLQKSDYQFIETEFYYLIRFKYFDNMSGMHRVVEYAKETLSHVNQFFHNNRKDLMGEIYISKLENDIGNFNYEEIYKSEVESDKLFLGFNAFGRNTIPLSEMGHILIEGSTGTGKSSFLKSLLCQSLLNDKIRNIIIDPKKIEFESIKNHSNIERIINEVKEANDFLENTIKKEVESRKIIFESAFEDVPNSLSEYNNRVEKSNRKDIPKLPYIFVWIDELAYLDSNSSFSRKLSHWKKITRAFGIFFIVSSNEGRMSSRERNYRYLMDFNQENHDGRDVYHLCDNISEMSRDGYRYSRRDLMTSFSLSVGGFNFITRDSTNPYPIKTPYISNEVFNALNLSELNKEKKECFIELEEIDESHLKLINGEDYDEFSLQTMIEEALEAAESSSDKEKDPEECLSEFEKSLG